MKFLRVYTDVGKNKPVILFAKVVREHGNTYDIRYFSPVQKLPSGQSIFNYESVVYTIDDESIVERIQGDDERVIGYEKMDNGWVRLDENDPEYQPSESEEGSESDSVSLEEEELSEDQSDVQEDDWVDDDDE